MSESVILQPGINRDTSTRHLLTPDAGGVVAYRDHQHKHFRQRNFLAILKRTQNIFTHFRREGVAIRKHCVVFQFTLFDFVEDADRDLNLDHSCRREHRVRINGQFLSALQMSDINPNAYWKFRLELLKRTIEITLLRDSHIAAYEQEKEKWFHG